MAKFDFGSIDFNFNFDDKEGDNNDAECFEYESRYVTPPETPEQDSAFIKYENASKLSNTIDLKKRSMIIVNGSFIMGDFLEALVVNKNLHIKKMVISTLSLSENNIDSLRNLIDGGFVEKMDLLISDYFFKTEQEGHGQSLMPYLYQELDNDNKFQLSVSRSHTKIVIFETFCGLKITIHGSANLRSSANLENLMVENNQHLYDFLEKDIYSDIINKYWTIDHEKLLSKEAKKRRKTIVLPNRRIEGGKKQKH